MTFAPTHSLTSATLSGEADAPLFACQVEAGGTWLANGSAAPWAAWVAKARRSVMGGARRWRLTRADGSIAWEGRCATLPKEAPADKTVTVEGNDGALARVTVGAALEQGWLTAEEAATRRAPPDVFDELFADRVRVAAPVGHLPGATSAAERARRLAEEDALVEEADGAELRG